MKIRYATLADAKRIAEINTEGWQTAYRGIIPDEILDAMDVQSRIEAIRSSLIQAPNQDLVCEDESQRILGFVSFGKMRWEQFCEQCDCELYAIYVESNARGKGVGKALFQATLAEFKSQGKRSMLVNVLEGNASSVKFYQHLGGQVIGNKDFTLQGINYPQLTFAFGTQ